jgi:alpha-L-arabinofuranosidase
VEEPREVEVAIQPVRPRAEVVVHTIAGADIGVSNTFADREQVTTITKSHDFGRAPTFTTTLAAHSVTALVFTC